MEQRIGEQTSGLEDGLMRIWSFSTILQTNELNAGGRKEFGIFYEIEGEIYQADPARWRAFSEVKTNHQNMGNNAVRGNYEKKLTSMQGSGTQWTRVGCSDSQVSAVETTSRASKRNPIQLSRWVFTIPRWARGRRWWWRGTRIKSHRNDQLQENLREAK